jgi:hypothetical protein
VQQAAQGFAVRLTFCRFQLETRGERSPARKRSFMDGNELIEAISKIGFWFKVAAAARFKPEEYYSILRI